MVQITFVEHDGTEHPIEAEAGLTLMEAAVSNAVPGIDAECGGACMCATCHVYVDELWRERLPAKTEDEESMLEFATAATESSRLGCQVPLTEEHDGLVVRIPDSQQ
jgi:2Fe-2S ferredoxin